MGRFFCPNFCSPQNYAIIPVATASVVCASMSLCTRSAASAVLLLYSSVKKNLHNHPRRHRFIGVLVDQDKAPGIPIAAITIVKERYGGAK